MPDVDELLAVIAELGLELHPDRVHVVASKIEGLGSVKQFALVRPAFGPNADKLLIAKFGTAWRGTDLMSPRDVAAALRGASATAVEQEHRGSVELTWTGPASGQVPIRHTEQVLKEVINAAQRRLFIVSFVAYQVNSISKALVDAVARGVQIDVLLESSSRTEAKSIMTQQRICGKRCRRLGSSHGPHTTTGQLTSIQVWSMRNVLSRTARSPSSLARTSPPPRWSATWNSASSSKAATSQKNSTITLRR